MRRWKIGTRSAGATLAFSIVFFPEVAAYETILSEWEGSSVGGEVEIVGTGTGGNATVIEPGSGERNPIDIGATVIWPGTPAAPGGGAPVVNPAELVRISDVKKLVMDAGQVSISPNRTWVYVNKPVYFATDAVAHDRQLTILGRAVTVHLTPVGYTWDPGDGSASFTTTGAGGTWPDGDVSHAYRKARSGISVGLTVEWSATFTVQGTTYPVAGTTTASTASPLFETREAEAVLTR